MERNNSGIPGEVYDSLYQILDRLWDDEKEDYEGRMPEDKDGHLFEALTSVRKWLTSIKPEEALNES